MTNNDYTNALDSSLKFIFAYLSDKTLADSERYRVESKMQKIIDISEKITRDMKPTAWSCDECGMIFKIKTNTITTEPCYKHLQEVHGYPDEDAALSCKAVYNITDEEIKKFNFKADNHPEVKRWNEMTENQKKEQKEEFLREQSEEDFDYLED
jgi:hypothetical protein